MSRLTTFISKKDLNAKSIAAYCAYHPCPELRYCGTCIAWFHNKENLRDFLDEMVQIKH